MIVVTGATGNVGRALVGELSAAGHRVTAVSRSVTAADVPDGVVPVRGDLTRPDDLVPALAGAEALFLLTSGEFLGSGAGLDGVLKLARDNGIRRIVLLSSQGVGTGRHPAGLEDAVRRSGPEWTILRAGGFMSNALQWAESVRAQRIIAAPFADVALPLIDPADIAAAAATTLVDDGHAGRVYTLTGPAPISPREQAAAIGAAIGEPVRLVELTRADAAAAMRGYLPEPVVEGTLDILGDPTPEERLADPAVAELLGRPAGGFAAWAARYADAFR
ncbi:SDR family oxidoreductase [Nocardia sp. NPDC004068]|uniref:SDR family oxidoreductase n=1 Tax=Nocardia sp. NPDC004068 TaxID=3364303 RepID=UPI0036BAA907